MLARTEQAGSHPEFSIARQVGAVPRCAKVWPALFLAVAVAGCAASRAEGEAVYLKQHRASIALTQILLSAEVENPSVVDVLYESESALNKACAPLQEASYRQLSGDAVDPILKFKAYNALEFCEATARDVEDLLWRIDPETAGHYLDRPLVSVRAAQ